MENKILSYWRSQQFPENTTVYCAVSGGADSMAMLHALLLLQKPLSLTVKAVHFNHRLRGAESDRDEAFVRSFCAQNAVSLLVGNADVAEISKKTGESIEECARRERYAYFSSLDGFVATAHTQEDNLETALLNLIRGTALKGLCGIPPRRENLLRPMLCVSHDAIRSYLTAHGIAHVEDSTNAQPDCLRNRIRQTVLPLLRQENPSVFHAFLETSELLRKDEALLTALAEQALAAARTGGGFSCKQLAALEEPLRRRAIRAVLNQHRICKLTRNHITACEKLILSDNPSGCVILPDGLTLRRAYDVLFAGPTSVFEKLPEIPLKIGQEVPIPQQNLTVHTEYAVVPPEFTATPDRFAVLADRETLCIRSRKPQDSIRLSGGTKTLKKLFIDRKIPLKSRELVPVFADQTGVLAVFGIGVNLQKQAKSGEKAVIITIKRGYGCI